jgi:hypothetical protein
VTKSVKLLPVVDAAIHSQFNAQPQNLLDFVVEQFAGQLRFGRFDAQSSTRLALRVDQHTLVTGLPQVVGGGQSGRSGADHRHPFSAGRAAGRQIRVVRR